MKTFPPIAALFAVFVLASAASVRADMPTLNITSPTGIVNVAAFPANTQIAITIQHSQLKDLNVFNVRVDGVSLTGGDVGNPFNNDNTCKSPNLTSVTSTCVTNGSDTANVTVPWTVPSAGSYTLTVVVKHGGTDGDDEEVVQFQLLSVEHIAPPAIANTYINSSAALKAAYGKQRGCIISHIAREHGQNEAYGAKPGPYNEAWVEADVANYGALCY